MNIVVLEHAHGIMEHTLAIKLYFLKKLSDTLCEKRNVFMLSLGP